MGKVKTEKKKKLKQEVCNLEGKKCALSEKRIRKFCLETDGNGNFLMNDPNLAYLLNE